MYIASQEIGVPVPNNTEHAVSVTLPTWDSIIGYEEGDQNIVGKMQTGYPRFFIHKSIQKLVEYLMGEYGRIGVEDLFVYPSYNVAKECKDYLSKRIKKMEPNHDPKVLKKIRIVKLVTPSPKSSIEKNYRAQLSIGLVFFPIQYYKYAKEFWQHSGEGISSRLSEYLLYEFKYEKSLKSQNVHNDLLTDEDKKFVEEKFGRNLNFLESDNANSIIRKRLSNQIKQENPDASIDKDDVFLFPSGMSSIYNAHKIFLSNPKNIENKTVVWGFPYVDTLNISEKFGAGLIHLGHGTDEELEWLDEELSSNKFMIKCLVTECPSNPLLKTPNLIKLKQCSEKHGFPIIIDETVGNCINISVYEYGDIICSSLTKIFSGDSNVLAGCFVVNKSSKFYPEVSDYLKKSYEVNFWKEDCVYLERNSRDFLQRNDKTNHNALQAVELFKNYQAKGLLKEIFYPTTNPSSLKNYSVYKNKNGGYGGLLSIILNDTESSRKFYDFLKLSKGPSLGTNFTLVCPYAVLVHYNEMDHVKQFGVHEDLIRISIGLEPTDELLKTFEDALIYAAS